MTGLFGTTPGPWWVFNDDSGDRPYPSPSIQAPESEDCAVVHWDGFRQDYWQSANGDVRQISANVRAIAQVPAMLALVQAVARETSFTSWLSHIALAHEIVRELKEK